MKTNIFVTLLLLLSARSICGESTIPYHICNSDGNERGFSYVFDVSESKMSKAKSFNPLSASHMPLKTKDLIKIANENLHKFDAKKENYRISSITLHRATINEKNKWYYSIALRHKKYFFRGRGIYLYPNGELVQYKKTKLTEEKVDNDERIEKFNIIRPLFSKEWSLSIYSFASGKKIIFDLNEKDFVEQPKWNPAKEEIPLPIMKATKIAFGELKKYTRFPMEFSLDRIELKISSSKDKWYYLFSFSRSNDSLNELLRIPVLFSGKAIDNITRKEKKRHSGTRVE